MTYEEIVLLKGCRLDEQHKGKILGLGWGLQAGAGAAATGVGAIEPQPLSQSEVGLGEQLGAGGFQSGAEPEQGP